MKKTLFPRSLLLVLVAFTVLVVRAEPQVWTLVDGTDFEAELVSVYPTVAVFKTDRGKILKIPLERFSKEERTHIELEKPPKLSIDLIKDRNSMTFVAGMASHTTRPPEVHCHYGIRIKQTSPGNYNHELQVEYFVIGVERLGDRFILLDRQKTPFFLTKTNKRKFESRSAHTVRLRNFTVFKSVRGERYYGFLAIVKDVRGEIIAVRSSHDWILENLENLTERYVNNYMDDTCTRVYPTRPPVSTGA